MKYIWYIMHIASIWIPCPVVFNWSVNTWKENSQPWLSFRLWWALHAKPLKRSWSSVGRCVCVGVCLYSAQACPSRTFPATLESNKPQITADKHWYALLYCVTIVNLHRIQNLNWCFLSISKCHKYKYKYNSTTNIPTIFVGSCYQTCPVTHPLEQMQQQWMAPP